MAEPAGKAIAGKLAKGAMGLARVAVAQLVAALGAVAPARGT